MSLFRFLKRSLRARILLLVALGMAALAGILRVSGAWEIREISNEVLAERRQLAQVSADLLDYILRSNLTILQDASLEARLGMEGSDLNIVKAALRQASLRSIFGEGVFLLDRNGQLVWSEPRRPPPMTGGDSPFAPLGEALAGGRLAVSNLVQNGGRRIYAAVPVRDWRGEIWGAVGGVLDPESSRFRSLLQPVQIGDATTVEIVDSLGVVLASTNTERLFTQSDHARSFGRLIREKRAMVGTCRSCHEEEGHGRRDREVIAFVPLKTAPWGISLRRAERGNAASMWGTDQGLVIVGSATILVALIFAWGVARSVTKPLDVLAQSAQRIETGDLEGRIPALGEDEIGQLARSFDRMRQGLKTSLKTIAEGKRDLEKRVQERTRELEALTRELQRKEDIRVALLKQVIAAQEEERKRIARELHDETGQALATLLLSIDREVGAASDEVKSRLYGMKSTAEKTLAAIHRLIFDLRPSMLDDLGLPSALRWTAESRLEPMGIDLSFEVIGPERRLTPEIETTLFRIGQEAIANIARHAEAESVGITITFGEREIRLRLEDNGKGFDPAEAGKGVDGPRGLGLLGMRERAALVSGTLVIDSESRKGTRLEVTIPLSGDSTKERPA